MVPIKFWLKFAFDNTKSVTGTCTFFDAEGHELATFTMDSVTTLKNDDADGKLVLNAAQGEFVKTWDKQDSDKCGPLGTDTVNPTVLTWETQSAYRSTGAYTAEWQIIAHKQLGFG